jgi:addiction module HigA family antidote
MQLNEQAQQATPAGQRRRRPTHPGELLKEDVLPALNISISQAADLLHVSRQMLHRILKGEAEVSPEMALRLGKFCGNGPEIWLAMQQAVNLWDAEQRIGTAIAEIPTCRVQDHFPP